MVTIVVLVEVISHGMFGAYFYVPTFVNRHARLPDMPIEIA
ncbi:MAG: hypothetical protein ACRBBQ_00010 [Cognatishimia sp.]